MRKQGLLVAVEIRPAALFHPVSVLPAFALPRVVGAPAWALLIHRLACFARSAQPRVGSLLGSLPLSLGGLPLSHPAHQIVGGHRLTLGCRLTHFKKEGVVGVLGGRAASRRRAPAIVGLVSTSRRPHRRRRSRHPTTKSGGGRAGRLTRHRTRKQVLLSVLQSTSPCLSPTRKQAVCVGRLTAPVELWGNSGRAVV